MSTYKETISSDIPSCFIFLSFMAVKVLAAIKMRNNVKLKNDPFLHGWFFGSQASRSVVVDETKALNETNQLSYSGRDFLWFLLSKLKWDAVGYSYNPQQQFGATFLWLWCPSWTQALLVVQLQSSEALTMLPVSSSWLVRLGFLLVK